MLVIFKGSGN